MGGKLPGEGVSSDSAIPLLVDVVEFLEVEYRPCLIGRLHRCKEGSEQKEGEEKE